MSAWRDMATAPKDGSWFLCRWYAATKDGSCSHVAVQARFIGKIGPSGPYYETWDYRLFTNPTKWAPLPDD